MIQASKGKDKVAQRGNLLSSADLSVNDLTMEAAAKMVGKSEAPTDLAGTHSMQWLSSFEGIWSDNELPVTPGRSLLGWDRNKNLLCDWLSQSGPTRTWGFKCRHYTELARERKTSWNHTILALDSTTKPSMIDWWCLLGRRGRKQYVCLFCSSESSICTHQPKELVKVHMPGL